MVSDSGSLGKSSRTTSASGRISSRVWALETCAYYINVDHDRIISREPLQILSWFWPLAASPTNDSGLEFEVNEFEGSLICRHFNRSRAHDLTEPSLAWPPPDPDRMPRPPRQLEPADAFVYGESQRTSQDEIDAFRRRQAQDLERWNTHDATFQRRKPFHKRFAERESADLLTEDHEGDESPSESGEEAWRNGEGERLADFGVDEEVEFYDEDDVPLSELIERRDKKSIPRQG